MKVLPAVPVHKNRDFAVSFAHLKLERKSFVFTGLDSIGIFWLGVGTSSYR